MHVKSFDIYLSVSDSRIVDVVLKCCLVSCVVRWQSFSPRSSMIVTTQSDKGWTSWRYVALGLSPFFTPCHAKFGTVFLFF